MNDISAARERAYGETTFQVALPHAILALGTGAIGVTIAIAASNTLPVIAGAVIAMIGVYGFFAVVFCGFTHCGRPEGYRQNIGHVALTGVGAAIAEVLSQIVRAVIYDLVFNHRR